MMGFAQAVIRNATRTPPPPPPTKKAAKTKAMKTPSPVTHDRIQVQEKTLRLVGDLVDALPSRFSVADFLLAISKLSKVDIDLNRGRYILKKMSQLGLFSSVQGELSSTRVRSTDVFYVNNVKVASEAKEEISIEQILQ